VGGPAEATAKITVSASVTQGLQGQTAAVTLVQMGQHGQISRMAMIWRMPPPSVPIEVDAIHWLAPACVCRALSVRPASDWLAKSPVSAAGAVCP
jgi:hypothetical protein